MKLRQYEMGERFIKGIEDRASWATLDHAWESAEALPTLEEIEAKWPVADLEVRRLGHVVFPELVIPPRGGVAAARVELGSGCHVAASVGLADGSAYLGQAWSFYLEALMEEEGYFETLPYMEELKTRMARRMAESMSVDRRMINIKATTTEGLGIIGKGEGIGAMSVVLVS